MLVVRVRFEFSRFSEHFYLLIHHYIRYIVFGAFADLEQDSHQFEFACNAAFLFQLFDDRLKK